MRWTNANEAQRRRRRSDGLTGITARAGGAEVGRNGRAGAAARSSGSTRQVVRIPGLPTQRAHGIASAREFGQVGFSEDNGARHP